MRGHADIPVAKRNALRLHRELAFSIVVFKRIAPQLLRDFALSIALFFVGGAVFDGLGAKIIYFNLFIIILVLYTGYRIAKVLRTEGAFTKLEIEKKKLGPE
jgi:hypothetical protein